MPVDIRSAELEEEELRCTRFVARVRRLMVEVVSLCCCRGAEDKETVIVEAVVVAMIIHVQIY